MSGRRIWYLNYIIIFASTVVVVTCSAFLPETAQHHLAHSTAEIKGIVFL